jgi:hypothetical protein
MTFAEYLTGVALLAIAVAGLAVAAAGVRRALLPGWRGSRARLVEAVAGAGLFVLLAQALGTFGLLTRAGLVAGTLATAAAGTWAARRDRHRAPVPAPGPPPGSTRISSPSVLLALGVGGLLLLQWSAPAFVAITDGSYDADTLWHHMPWAARFAAEGMTTELHQTSFEPLVTFYPQNAELFHAGSLLLLGSDLLFPLLNLGWLGLALLAAWCVGRPYSAGPAVVVGVGAVLAMPILVRLQAGTAKNDAAGLALLLAAAALTVNARGRRAATLLAGAAAGLAVGVKLSLVVPALALAGAAVVAARRGERQAEALAWGAGIALMGAYWYVRNLIRVGNPLPQSELGPLSLPSPELLPDSERFVLPSIADYLTDGEFWRDVYLPSLSDGLGVAWWAAVALAVAAVAVALASGPARPLRALGAATAVALVAYVFTPATAGGSPSGTPHLVYWSLRYATPAIALGLALVPLVLPAWSPRRQAGLLGLLAALFVATLASPLSWPARPGPAAAVIALAGVAAAGAALGLRGKRIPVGPVALACTTLALGGVAAGWAAERRYEERRYADTVGDPLGPAFAWARGIEDARIALVGTVLQYPLYGKLPSNHVQYVARAGPHGAYEPIRRCEEWRRAINHGRYDFVVTTPFGFPFRAHRRPPAEAIWTEDDPAAAVVRRDPRSDVTVFRLRGRLDPVGCPHAGRAS